MPLKDLIARRAYQLEWEHRKYKNAPRKRLLSKAQKDRRRDLERMRREAGTRSMVWEKSETAKHYRREYARKWRAANPDRQQATNKRAYERNLARRPACYREYAKQWQAKNPERKKECDRKSYLKHRVSRCDRVKKWRKNNPVLVLAFGHARRARKRAAIIEDCSAKIARLKQARFCHWCCDTLTTKTVTIDHVVPLARGGKHCCDNLVASCFTCNTSRKAKLVSEWTWREAA